MSVDQEIIIKSRCVCAHFQKILLDIPPSTQQCLLLRHLIVWDRIHRAQEKGVETAIFPFNNPPRTEFEQSGLVAGRCPIDETDWAVILPQDVSRCGIHGTQITENELAALQRQSRIMRKQSAIEPSVHPIKTVKAYIFSIGKKKPAREASAQWAGSYIISIPQCCQMIKHACHLFNSCNVFQWTDDPALYKLHGNIAQLRSSEKKSYTRGTRMIRLSTSS